MTVTGRTGYGAPDRVASAAVINSTSTICSILWRKVQYEDEEINYKVMRKNVFTTAEQKQVYNKKITERKFYLLSMSLPLSESFYMFTMRTLDMLFRHQIIMFVKSP